MGEYLGLACNFEPAEIFFLQYPHFQPCPPPVLHDIGFLLYLEPLLVLLGFYYSSRV